MKSTMLQIFSLLVIPPLAQAQVPFFCLADYHPTAPEIAIRAGISGSFAATFAVKDFRAVDIEIGSADSMSLGFVELFRESVRANVVHLTYFRDTTKATVVFHYRSVPSGELSNSYSEIVHPNEVSLVFRRVIQKIVDGVESYSPDTATVARAIEFKPGSQHKSDILVRLFFQSGADSVQILENSHPDRTEDILAVARSVKQPDFHHGLRVKVWLVKIFIQRYVSDCDCYQTW
jgi:hypothetical protein